MLVHVIADYGIGDLAFAEVLQRMMFHLPDAEPIPLPIPAFSTLAAGFCIAQLGLHPAPPGTLIYHNVAPREDDPESRPNNAGERLTYAQLPTGVRVIGVNAGYALSFIKEMANTLRWAAAPAAGSQFRSRDLFPQAAAAIVLGFPHALGEEIDVRMIPDPPSSSVAYVDGYGNMKTTMTYDHQQVRPGKRIRLRIGEIMQEVIASDGVFTVSHGELAFAPGSSGWPLRHGRSLQWMEIFLRGGNAWSRFGNPPVGASVVID